MPSCAWRRVPRCSSGGIRRWLEHLGPLSAPDCASEALALGLAALKPVASEPSRAASSDLVELALAQGKARRLDFFTCPARWMRCSTAWRSWARGICRRTTPPACASARADVRQPTARC